MTIEALRAVLVPPQNRRPDPIATGAPCETASAAELADRPGRPGSTLSALPERLEAWRRRVVAAVTSPEPVREVRLSRFLHDYRERRAHPASCLRCLLDRPARTLLAAHDLLRLPRLAMPVSDSRDGGTMRRAVLPPWSPLRLLPHAAVLVVPETVEDYLRGSSKQTMRQAARKARRLGVTWRTVEDLPEQRRLVAVAEEWERNTPRLRYRNPNARHDDLFDTGRWLLATAADGRPLVLSVIPVDGEWAMLQYFRSLEAGEEASLARWFLMTVVVEHLITAGVRYLFNAGTPIRISNGLRHYQRMIGFRTFRLTVRRAPVTPASA